ncbi:MAG: GNAT family N-acetyltransferase [Mycobacteriales bacterium]
MEVQLFSDAEVFLREAAGYLATDPFSASVIAVYAGRVRAGGQPQGPDDLWVTVSEGGLVVGLAMHTPPHHLFLARMPEAAAAALADALAELRRPLPGVTGESAAGVAFTAAWQARTGGMAVVTARMRMYRLVDLQPPAGVPGDHRRASVDDTGVVAGWAAAFHNEAQPQNPAEDWPAWAARRINSGELYLWVTDDSPVAMAAHSAPAAGVARVGPVYTPPLLRRHGFGAAVTAAATAGALEAGATHVVLYTDLSNATSNAIYQAIGYRPDHDAEERAFVPPRRRHGKR